MTNREMLMILSTAKFNFERVNPPMLQKAYHRNGMANLERAIKDLEDRIQKGS